MEPLLLFAIGIDDLRDVFRADPALSERLRGLAAARFPAPGGSSRRRALTRVGPLLRRHPATQVDPARPSAADLELILAGGHVPTGRLLPCWRLFVAFLEELARDHRLVVIEDPEALEFDLARAGLPSQFALRNLALRPLGIPLPPLAGHIAGYTPHAHAAATLAALDAVGARAEGLPRRAEAIREFLRVVASDEALDLVVVGVPD